MNLLDFLHQTVAQVSTMPGGVVVLSKATLLLAVAWLIHFALAKANPRWRALLWRGAAVGLLSLVVWTVGLPGYAVRVEGPEPVAVSRPSLPPEAPPSSPPPVVAAFDPVVFMGAPTAEVEAPVFDEITTAALVEPFSVDVSPEAARPIEASRPPVPWLAVLAGIWATGVVLLVVRLAVAYVRLASLLRNSQSAPEAVTAEIRRIAATLGCHAAVRVRRCERFAVPFLYGLRRPVLVLPQRMCETSYRPRLPGILAHELAHTRSRDLMWNAVLQAVSIGLWFHPLAWRIGLAHQAACDRVADAVSAAYLGDVQAYCQTLARVALEVGSPVPSVGLAMARHSDVRRRLALLQRKLFATPLQRRLVTVVGLVGLVVFGLLAGVRFVVAEAAPPTGDEQQSQTDSPPEERSGVRPMQIKVVDSEGNPIAGAGVTVRSSLPTRFVSANDEGIADIEVSTAETLRLSILVWHDEFVTARLRWPSGTPRESIPANYIVTLARGTVLGGIVHNEQGEPLAGAEVTIRGSKSSPDKVLGWSINDIVTSDADGKWSSRRIPEDMEGYNTEISVNHRNYVGHAAFEVAQLSLDELRARTAEMVVRLEIRGWIVAVRVVDRETKAPMTKFRVALGEGRGSSVNWGASLPVETEGGRYRVAWDPQGDSPHVLRIEAQGHLPSDTLRLKPDERLVTFDVELDRGEDVAGVVLSPGGKPLADARVALCMENQGIWLEHGHPVQWRRHLIVRTGADGRFSFTPQRESYSLIVAHNQGYTRVTNEEGVKAITIQPWARVEGMLRIGSRPAAGQRVTLDRETLYAPTASGLYYNYRTNTDEQGRFTFERVVPGKGRIARRVMSGQGQTVGWTPTHSISATFVAGETTQVELSRDGRHVVGKLLLPDDREEVPPWSFVRATLRPAPPASEIPSRPEIPWPADIDPEKDRDRATAWFEAWIGAEEGRLYPEEVELYETFVRNRESAAVRAEVEQGGSFLFEDMPAGDYRLTVLLRGPSAIGGTRLFNGLDHEFTIPDMPGGRSDEPLDLGDLTLSLPDD